MVAFGVSRKRLRAQGQQWVVWPIRRYRLRCRDILEATQLGTMRSLKILWTRNIIATGGSSFAYD
jgi:hypothetical protein